MKLFSLFLFGFSLFSQTSEITRPPNNIYLSGGLVLTLPKDYQVVCLEYNDEKDCELKLKKFNDGRKQYLTKDNIVILTCAEDGTTSKVECNNPNNLYKEEDYSTIKSPIMEYNITTPIIDYKIATLFEEINRLDSEIKELKELLDRAYKLIFSIRK